MTDAPARRTGLRSLLRTYRGALIVALGAMIVATLLDRVCYRTLTTDRLAELEGQVWYPLLRSFGELRLWGLVAVAAVIWHSIRAKRRHEPIWDWRTLRAGVLMFSGALAAGGLSEIVKLIVRRYRPNQTDGAYLFKGFEEGVLNSSNVGFPSSHTAVAFGGQSWWRACFRAGGIRYSPWHRAVP